MPRDGSGTALLKWWCIRKECLRKGFWVSGTSDLSSLARFANLMLLFLGQLDLERIDILLEPCEVGGAWDRDDVVSLRHQPSESELRRCCILLLGNRGDLVHELEILGEVLRCKVNLCSLERGWLC